MVGHRRSRPALEIHEDQPAYLISHPFRVMDIATMFGCSTHTIQRRMRDFGMDSNSFMK